MTNTAESHLLAEQMVRPISAMVPLILWVVAVVATVSVITPFFKPVPDFVPGWMRMLDGALDIFAVILVPLITLTLATVFTVLFFWFPGVRYRIFTDRIEYQRGKYFHLVPLQKMFFGEWQTLSFNELNTICWQVQGIGDENPHDTTFIEFHFTSCIFQTHICFALSGKVADACRSIERETIAPKILQSLADGKIVAFLRPDKFPSYEIELDDKVIRDWDQHRFSWNEICEIGFSKGNTSGTGNFLPQSCIRIKNLAGETMEFDMPRHNPHAFWAVIKDRCSLPTLRVLDFPKQESHV